MMRQQIFPFEAASVRLSPELDTISHLKNDPGPRVATTSFLRGKVLFPGPPLYLGHLALRLA
jgi:hypothetical protein